jgi:hypothetical protein
LQSLQPLVLVVNSVTEGFGSAHPENGHINMATPDHAERLGTVKGCSPRNQSDGLLASIDDITDYVSTRSDKSGWEGGWASGHHSRINFLW